MPGAAECLIGAGEPCGKLGRNEPGRQKGGEGHTIMMKLSVKTEFLTSNRN